MPTATPGARPITIGSTRRHTTVNAAPVDPQDVRVQDDLERNQRGVQDPVGQEQQRKRHRQGREAVPECAVDDGRPERDGSQGYLIRFHVLTLSLVVLIVLRAVSATLCPQ